MVVVERITAVQLFNLPLADHHSVLDCRPAHRFAESSLASSFNVAPPTSPAHQPALGEVVRQALRHKLDTDPADVPGSFVVYDDDGGGHFALQVAEELCASARELGVRCVRLVAVPYADVKAQFPLLCDVDLTDLPFLPSQITPHLFLGSSVHANDARVLQALRITNVLNVTVECPNTFAHNPAISYLQCKVEDAARQDMSQAMQEGHAFIDAANRAQQRVLVHCHQGRSRSATVVIAHLMAARKWGLEEALEHVRACRPVVRPNDGFMRQLRDAERAALASPSSPE